MLTAKIEAQMPMVEGSREQCILKAMTQTCDTERKLERVYVYGWVKKQHLRQLMNIYCLLQDCVCVGSRPKKKRGAVAYQKS